MILDRGVCKVYHKQTVEDPGSMPTYTDVLFHTSYYGELSFETSPARPTDYREEINTASRIRILQNRRINNHDRVELEPFDGQATPEANVKYEVTRAWHGVDEDSGEDITDLTLEVIAP